MSARQQPTPPGGTGTGPGHPASAGPGPGELARLNGRPPSPFPAPAPPRRWTVLGTADDGQSLTGPGPEARRLRVIWSDRLEADGRWWRHVSASLTGWRRRDLTPVLPSWFELEWLRRHLIGDERYAYQIHPADGDAVNLHPGTLHLWACLDVDRGAVLPDFTHGTGSI